MPTVCTLTYTLSFSPPLQLLDPEGAPHSYRTFEREAADAGFHLRTGTECNPGACYTYLGACGPWGGGDGGVVVGVGGVGAVDATR